MSSRISRFVLRLDGESKGLARDIGKSSKLVNKYADTWKRAGQAIQLAVGVQALKGGFDFIAGQVQQSSDRVKELLNFSAIAQTSVRDLQAIDLAANRIGIDPDQVRDSLVDINERVSEFLQTGGGGGVDAFQIANIDPNSLASKQGIDRIRALADAFNSIENQDDRVFAIRSIAGDGRDILRLFDNIDEITSSGDFIDGLDLGINADDIGLLRDAQREVANITAAFEGFQNRLLVEVAPAVTDFLGSFDPEVVGSFVRGVTQFIGNLASNVGNVAGRLSEAAQEIFVAFREEGSGAFVSIILAASRVADEQIDFIINGIENRLYLFQAKFIERQSEQELRILSVVLETNRRNQLFLAQKQREIDSKNADDSSNAIANRFTSVAESFRGLFSGLFEFEAAPSKGSKQTFKKSVFDPLAAARKEAQSFVADLDKIGQTKAQKGIEQLNESVRKLSSANSFNLLDNTQSEQAANRIREAYRESLDVQNQISSSVNGVGLSIAGSVDDFRSRSASSRQADAIAQNEDRRQKIELKVQRDFEKALRDSAKKQEEVRKALEENTKEMKRIRVLTEEETNQLTNDITFQPVDVVFA